MKRKKSDSAASPAIPDTVEAAEMEASAETEALALEDLESDDDSTDDEMSLDGASDIDALDEFKNYDSLEEEHIGDDDLEELAGESDTSAEDDANAQVTPKERRLSDMRLEARIEAVIFASQKPLKVTEILDILQDAGLKVQDVQMTLNHLVDFYEWRQGGFRLHYLKRLGYQFQTSDAAGAIMERMFASRPRPISRAALETLAIIAYRQPVTRAEVEFIRGVDAGSIFKTLLERELIRCTGRKEIVGRPMLFGTTDEFLKVFNLSSVKDLPTLESFQPAREMVQGAMAKIESGDDLTDVEDYIADNTRGEYEEGEELLLEGATGEDELVASAEESPEAPAEESPEAPAETPTAKAVEETPVPEMDRIFQGASAAPEDGLLEESHGEDQDSEVAIPTGNSVPTGSGDLDH